MASDISGSPINVTILAAFISSAAAILGLIISKESKISEFRQKWIDDLRNELADVIAQAAALGTIPYRTYDSNDSKSSEIIRILIPLNVANAKVKMRLNKNEPASMKLIDSIDLLEAKINKNNTTDWDEIKTIGSEILKYSNIILKLEWERVKRGEDTFVCVKNLAFSIFVLILIYGTYSIFR